jgi:hypothetical protein
VTFGEEVRKFRVKEMKGSGVFKGFFRFLGSLSIEKWSLSIEKSSDEKFLFLLSIGTFLYR